VPSPAARIIALMRATGSQTAAGVAFGLTPSTIVPTKPEEALPLRLTSALDPPARE
jgi:hypothetical protein